MKTLIGIDADVTKSGVAVKVDNTYSFYNLSFFELFDFLKTIENPIVYIECGFLNKSNWHAKGSIAMAAQIGQRTGANHEVSKKLCEMCEYLKIEFVQVKPTRSKVDAATFKKLTKYEGRTNQETRDAAMLLVGR